MQGRHSRWWLCICRRANLLLFFLPLGRVAALFLKSSLESFGYCPPCFFGNEALIVFLKYHFWGRMVERGACRGSEQSSAPSPHENRFYFDSWAKPSMIMVILYFSTAYNETLKGISFFRACLHMSLFIIASKETAEVQTQLFSISLANIMLLQH